MRLKTEQQVIPRTEHGEKREVLKKKGAFDWVTVRLASNPTFLLHVTRNTITTEPDCLAEVATQGRVYRKALKGGKACGCVYTGEAVCIPAQILNLD